MTAAKKKPPAPSKPAPRPKATTPKLDLERVVGVAIGGFLETLLARSSAPPAANGPEQLELRGVLPAPKSVQQQVDEAYQRGYERGYADGLHEAGAKPMHRGDVDAGFVDAASEMGARHSEKKK